MKRTFAQISEGVNGEAIAAQLRRKYTRDDGTLQTGALSVCFSRVKSALSSTDAVNMHALSLTKSELLSLTREREAALIQKQESLLHVPHQWLPYAICLARQSTPQMSYARLAIPLLLLSGRRCTEILNGKSTFAPTSRPTTCLFTGAIKKRGQSTPFEIPLLCDYQTFAFALCVLHVKQGGEKLDPETTHNRYAKNLKLSTLFPIQSPHQLRAVYAAFVYHLYSSNVTFNRAAMMFLGHEKLETSLSYNSVVLHGDLPAGVYGALP